MKLSVIAKLPEFVIPPKSNGSYRISPVFFCIFKKLGSVYPELFGDLFFHCYMALEKFFFFVSLLYDYDLMVKNVN